MKISAIVPKLSPLYKVLVKAKLPLLSPIFKVFTIRLYHCDTLLEWERFSVYIFTAQNNTVTLEY